MEQTMEGLEQKMKGLEEQMKGLKSEVSVVRQIFVHCCVCVAHVSLAMLMSVGKNLRRTHVVKMAADVTPLTYTIPLFLDHASWTCPTCMVKE